MIFISEENFWDSFLPRTLLFMGHKIFTSSFHTPSDPCRAFGCLLPFRRQLRITEKETGIYETWVCVLPWSLPSCIAQRTPLHIPESHHCPFSNEDASVNYLTIWF